MSNSCLYCGLSASPPQSLHNGNRYQHFDNKLLPVDISLVKSVILAVEGDIQSIDDQLNHLEALTIRLLAERSHAAAELTKYRCLIAPVRRLPNEILSKIFSFTCTDMSDSIDVIKSPPWVLSHVCSRWRSFCLSSPRLWSTVAIPPMNSKRYHVADILGSYLDRSHGLLLDLYLDARASTKRIDVDRDGRHISILRILHPHRSRWHKLVLSCDTYLAILDIINIWEYRNPSLTHLKKIDIRTSEAPRYDPAYSTSAFSRALNLESIHLRGSVLLENPSFPHLTSFLGTFSSVVQFRELIESAPSLRDISIWYKPSTSTPDIFPPTPFTHPNICKVTVHALTACFSSVIFPSLEELVTDSGVYESNFDPEHVNHLSSLTGNSHSPRRSLSMKVLSPSHLTPFLTPGLTSLTIEILSDTSREVYGTLMYDPESSYPVAPNLAHLSIKELSPVSDPNILTDDACLRMVLSRATMLQSVVLQIIRVFHYTQPVTLKGARPRPLLNDFKSLRSSRGQDGLDVRIRWTERLSGLGTEHDRVLDLI